MLLLTQPLLTLGQAVKDYGVLNDNDDIEICRNESDIEEYVTNIARSKGLRLSIMKTFCSPFGIECYASNPRSFVIDYDGSIQNKNETSYH